MELTANTTSSAPLGMRNGCPVYYREGNCTVLKHPKGYMLYVGGWRVGTYKGFPNAWRRAQKEMAR